MKSACKETATVLQSASILVVDDEPDVLSMVSEYLGREGYSVGCCESSSELDRALEIETPDLILLDVNLPDENGISVVRRLQARRPLPIVMLTALADPIDRVVGLEVGADDYVTKPFDLRELSARVRAVLRRSKGAGVRSTHGPTQALSKSKVVPFCEAFLDLDARNLVDPEGRQISVTATEFEMLETFAKHPNRVLSRDMLLGDASEHGSGCRDRAIDIRVTRLRKRVEPNPARPQVIRTVRSVGYVYVPPR
ncbi:MAG: response regulator transcription factor [Rhizobiaceae bacterium]|nr:response regulator transcription factor [Rhizobiaceae bacterium]